MDENEKYVRSRWTDHDIYLYESARSYHLKLGWVKEFKGTTKDKSGVWSAARAFTERREREIAEVQEEIAWLSDGMDCSDPNDEVGQRILARLQAVLAELRRGMKEGSE